MQGSIPDAGCDWDQEGVEVGKSSKRKAVPSSDGGTTSVRGDDGGMAGSVG